MHIKKLLLRIGAFDYEPLPIVKKHTFDERLKEEYGHGDIKKQSASNSRETDLKEKMHLITTLTNMLKDG